MKLFSLDEANALLPELRPKLVKIQHLYERVAGLRDSARAAAGASEFGGGMAGGAAYVDTLYNIGKLTTELHGSGIELKDYTRGLIDFPSMRSGRVIHLCWQLDDSDEIQWWHETDAGFASRQPL